MIGKVVEQFLASSGFFIDLIFELFGCFLFTQSLEHILINGVYNNIIHTLSNTLTNTQNEPFNFFLRGTNIFDSQHFLKLLVLVGAAFFFFIFQKQTVTYTHIYMHTYTYTPTHTHTNFDSDID